MKKGLFFIKAAVATAYILAAYPSMADQSIEQIEVTGERTLAQLEKQIFDVRNDFYDMFNEHNTIDKFDVSCRVEKRIGSNLADKVCEPKYLKEARDRLLRERASSGMAIDLTRVPSEEEVQFAAKRDHEASLLHMQKLLEEVPELREQYLKLHDLVAKYQARKG